MTAEAPVIVDSPKVSIVIPVYNGANFLKEAIDSALAQTYPNVEVIVINDGSSDGGATDAVARLYGDRIRYFVKENGGVASALNFGIAKMQGRYFSWLSHDDQYEKTKIERQIAYLRPHTGEDLIVACNAKVLFASGLKKKVNIDANTFDFIDIFLATSANVGLNGCSLLVPKKAFEVCGTFDERLPLTQDYELWFRMKDSFTFVLLNQHLVISRQHAEQGSVKKKDALYQAGDELHSRLLNTIGAERFEEYFVRHKHNIEHMYQNYRLYKARGYSKTAAKLIKTILGYYYQHDKQKFRAIFKDEIEQPRTSEKSIDQEYEALLRSGTDIFPIKPPAAQTRSPKTRLGAISRQLRHSIREDGLYLTGEKTARKVYRRYKS
jgi:glycosyltransferase involved in cell wall biosynthesis